MNKYKIRLCRTVRKIGTRVNKKGINKYFDLTFNLKNV